MKISIIIPAYNEERYLPLLLDSIKRQSFTDYEIIVADANSTDHTVNVAREYGAKVVKGGMPGKGRNAGARAATGDFLFFFDADVVLPIGFLKNAYDEMQERFLDLATCEVVPVSDLYIDKVLHRLANLSIRMSQYSSPHAPGFCILVTKRLFDRIDGFDETLTMAEDHDFAKRASHFRPLRVLDTADINVSVRRLSKEGRAVLVGKYLQVELYRIFKGELRTEVIEYEFGKFTEDKDRRLKKQLQRFENDLIRITESYAAFTRKRPANEDQFTGSFQKQMDRFKGQYENIKDAFRMLFSKEQDVQ
jgi:glycosyltransferase involved in cell wall biosynthesis